MQHPPTGERPDLCPSPTHSFLAHPPKIPAIAAGKNRHGPSSILPRVCDDAREQQLPWPSIHQNVQPQKKMGAHTNASTGMPRAGGDKTRDGCWCWHTFVRYGGRRMSRRHGTGAASSIAQSSTRQPEIENRFEEHGDGLRFV